MHEELDRGGSTGKERYRGFASSREARQGSLTSGGSGEGEFRR
jgi:hypothetical protein